MSDLEGAVLSDYLLLECISKGGVADVYRARHMEEGSEFAGDPGNVGDAGYEVAVKIFRSGYAQRESFREYFMTEAEKIGLFEHPNILPFLEYGEGEGLLYMVTPFVKTGTLDELLRRVGGRFSALQALPIIQQLCSAVQYAHEHDVVHGNIKPSNVFIASDGRLLLADFGIARSYDDSQQSLTRIGWGSAEYISPEQSLGIVKRGSDIYALGAVLFRVLTGSPPFVGQTPVEVLLKHVRQQPPPARSLVPSISDAVDAVLGIALQKRIDDRYSSVEELSAAYLEAVTRAPVASPVARTAPPRVTLGTHTFKDKDNPKTPVPLYASSSTIADPQTPLPPYTVFDASHAGLPLPLQEDNSIPQVDFPHVPPIQPARRTIELPPFPEESDVEKTMIRQKDFLQELEDAQQRSALFWSTEPPEWSPIAQDVATQQQDGANASAESAASSAVPTTASAYLQSKAPAKPLVTKKLAALPSFDDIEPAQQIEPLPTEERRGGEQAQTPATVAAPVAEAGLPDIAARPPVTPSARLKKLLPLVVVILLVLGLLGALLSSFFYPTEKPSINSMHPAKTIAQAVTSTKPTSATATLATSASKTPISTAATTSQPTPKPSVGASPAPTPIPTSPPVPPFACTDGTITVDGTSEFSPVMQQVQSDYSTQCSTNSVTMTINADSSPASLNAVASGASDLAYSDIPATTHPSLVDYPLAVQTYAVVVNSDTNVTQLTTAQLQGIYSGAITNWSQLGGTDEPIVIIGRAQGSAIRTIFEHYVMQQKQTVASSAFWPDTTDVVMKKLLATSGSLTYVALGAVPTYGVQTVAINGVAAGTSTVINGSYPFWSMIHLYSNHTATGLALSLISFFSTVDGQNDLAAYGATDVKNVPLSVLHTHS